MNIIQIASEVVPFAKTGGLADVVGALPPHLEKLKHTVTIFLPLYKQVRNSNIKLFPTDIRVTIQIGNESVTGHIWKSSLPANKTAVYLVECDQYYNRDDLYGTPQGDYQDNAARFIFFSQAVIGAIRDLKLQPDIIHCHDWQSALIPVYLKTLYQNDPTFRNTKTVFTIHNLAYQGVFWHWDMKLTGLPWELFNWRQLEFYGKLNFLKGGLVFADALTTVSPTYSKEIQTSELGCGLEGVLQERSRDLYGIINGVDYSTWNPQDDSLVPAHYSLTNLKGKATCKQTLQNKLKLPVSNVPVVGMITRLAGQKGLDILLEIFMPLIKEDIQMVILGAGEEKYQNALKDICKRYPDKVSITIAFDNQLAHLITAGADMFLMPSHYEPCGLNQLYSMKYGTVPIVRQTGGLADTVVNYDETKNNIKSATGFSFKNDTAADLLQTIRRAIKSYQDNKLWTKLIKNGMKQDFSWSKSAQEYHKLYLKLMLCKGRRVYASSCSAD